MGYQRGEFVEITRRGTIGTFILVYDRYHVGNYLCHAWIANGGYGVFAEACNLYLSSFCLEYFCRDVYYDGTYEYNFGFGRSSYFARFIRILSALLRW